MPYGDFINNFPPSAFLLVHLAAFLVGAFLAYRSFEADVAVAGVGLLLFALAEISYMTYHLDWTVFLFTHTVSEVLDLGAFVLVFAGAVQHITIGRQAEARASAVTEP